MVEQTANNHSGNGKELLGKAHFYRTGPHSNGYDKDPREETRMLRTHIEPWLSALFQSEYLSLLLGNGISFAMANLLDAKPAEMRRCNFTGDYKEKIEGASEKSAERCGRGKPNFEDDIRIAIQLLQGLEIIEDSRAEQLRKDINENIEAFLSSILEFENSIFASFKANPTKGENALDILVSFLLSFASRAASRERLNIYTTNYDRMIEFGCDMAGLHVLDRFVGTLSPIFRASRLNIDLHYNPPGIRGEPRYLEGVIKISKVHGSIDWRMENGILRRFPIPFGAPVGTPYILEEPYESVMIFPNAAKDIETTGYPYTELFRDFSSSICRPNSVLVTYGYSFGDDHINRILRDMLSIPSTHLVIISFDEAEGRIQAFLEDTGHIAQTTILIGSHFGNITNLVEHYLPKPAIDFISIRMTDLLERRSYKVEDATQEVPENHD